MIKKIRAGIKNLTKVLPLQKVVLFGSYAKENYTVASDIDLLVVYRGVPRNDAFSLVRRHISLPRLEPHVYNEKEYSLVEDNLNRMTAEGIVIL